ncbi:hypothetical protein Tco_1296607 [Tanacetum coccineum]
MCDNLQTKTHPRALHHPIDPTPTLVVAALTKRTIVVPGGCTQPGRTPWGGPNYERPLMLCCVWWCCGSDGTIDRDDDGGVIVDVGGGVDRWLACGRRRINPARKVFRLDGGYSARRWGAPVEEGGREEGRLLEGDPKMEGIPWTLLAYP